MCWLTVRLNDFASVQKVELKLPRLPFAGVIKYTSKPFVQFSLMLKAMSFSILASNKIIINFNF